MKQIYYCRQGIYIPKYLNKNTKDGYYYPGMGTYVYCDETKIKELEETWNKQYDDFESLYTAADVGDIVKTFTRESPVRRHRQVYFSFYWSHGFDIKLTENKNNDCFPVKTKWKVEPAKDLKIAEVAEYLTADEFIEYCLERGMTAYALQK